MILGLDLFLFASASRDLHRLLLLHLLLLRRRHRRREALGCQPLIPLLEVEELGAQVLERGLGRVQFLLFAAQPPRRHALPTLERPLQ
ncbi:MAG: hypothetical protein AAFS07_19565, partial [Pseudomonadota bacterium]